MNAPFRLLVRQAEFDGVVRMTEAEIAKSDPEGAHRRAIAAAEQVYRVAGAA